MSTAKAPYLVPFTVPPSACLLRPAGYKTMRLSVQRLQLDDMLTGTPFPVVLAPALQQPPGAGAQPVLALTWASVLGGARGRSYLPLVAIRQALPALVAGAAAGLSCQASTAWRF